jgi:hypothetical protein
MYIHVITSTVKGYPWQNAQLVEKKLKPLQKLGRWLANQTRKENAHSLP